MKKISLLLFFFVSCFGFAQTKIKKEFCASDELLEQLIKMNPQIESNLENLDFILSKAKNTNLNASDFKITIPVVVFIVSGSSGASENITDTQVISQISSLNSYYADYGISFCLAKKDAIDRNTTGILRAVSPLSNHNAQTDQQSLNNLFPYYPSIRYLKIWVVKDINGIGNGAVQGYATFPGAAENLEGIVMRYTAFGDVSNCSCTILNPQTEKGKVLTHEVGHYLGLYHTFHQSCNGMNASTCNLEGDRVCDTPPVANPNNGCPLISTNTCHESTPDLPDDIHNYMDYVNENCMTQFTVGQKERMTNVLNTTRSILVSEENLILTGVACLPSLLSANFKANNYDVCSSNTSPIIFTPNTNPIGSTYTWDFGDGTTTQYVSTTLNTTQTHIYTVANDLPYIVYLTVSNGVDSVISTKQIFVNDCTPILNSESNWRFSGEPLALDFSTGVPIQVIVPSSAYYHYEGVANQSNPSGQLLFHSNGEKIWDVNNTIISNTLTGMSSAHQGTLILQNPSNTNQYYVFTRNGHPYEQPIRTGLRYSLVNISGSSVLPMTPSETNIVVNTPSGLGYTLTNDNGIEGGEGLSAIKSCDGYWIITTGLKGSAYYLMVYKLNYLGLSFVNEIALNTSITTNVLSIEASPDGNKIVLSAFDRRINQVNYFGGTYLYDFNKFNGTINNPINLNQNSGYGASFSPDSKLLYLNTGKGLFQYDINNVNPLSSMVRIFENKFSTPNDIQKGPDGKLYVACRGYNKYSVIHKPNNKITNDNPNACFFTFDGPITTTINTPPSGLPNFVDAKEETTYPNIATISSFPINCNTFKFVPNSCDSNFIWDFGDVASGSNNIYSGTVTSHTFSSDGTYIVKLKNSSNIEIATTTITIGIPSVTILGSTAACISEINIPTNNSVVLLPGQIASWNISSGNGIISGLNNQSEVTVNWITLPGTITLTITNISGCTSTITKDIESICCDCLNTGIWQSVQPKIAGNPASYCLNENTCPDFEYNLSYIWSFNNGTTLTTSEPCISEIQNGSLIVNNGLKIKILDSNNNQICSRTFGDVVINGKIAQDLNTESNLSNFISITPNPSNGLFSISTNQFKGYINYHIFDLNGRLIYEKTNDYFEKEKTINLSNIQSGIYIMKIEGENINYLTKIIKN